MIARPTLPGAALVLALALFSSPAPADALDDILARGSLRVGVAEFTPWTIRTRSGELVGFDIDVAEKVAADMGVSPDIRVYEWQDIIPALQEGEIDVIIGGMAITPERALKVNFSRPLAITGVSLATNTEKTRNVGSLDELDNENVVVTVVAETLSESVARTLFGNATLLVRATGEEAEDDVLEGRAHGYLATLPVVNFFALRHPSRVDVPLAEPLVASSEALAVRKGEQELLNFLDSWVTARTTDKWVNVARDYWFETIEWMPSVSK